MSAQGPYPELISVDTMDLLAPGVRGYTVTNERGLYVPMLIAERPGSGDVGRYLDSLPRDRRIVVPDVLSPVLQGMLLRRGFVVEWEYAEEFGESVECYVRPPA